MKKFVYIKKKSYLCAFFITMRKYNRIKYLVWVALVILFSACNATKFVPQDKYLLNDVKLKIVDTKDVIADDVEDYVQQYQNTEVLGFWKLQLGIYNTASPDTSKLSSRLARKVGEAPVIFSPDLADASVTQLTRVMQNKGYFNAKVDTTMKVKDRKVNLTYNIVANEPYTIASYDIYFQHQELMSVAQSFSNGVRPGMQFDADMLNQERQRVASAMRRRGYYYFDADCIRFLVDSTAGNRQVDVSMRIDPRVEKLPAEEKEKLFRQYYVSRVCFHLDYDPRRIPEDEEMFTNEELEYVFTWIGDKLLRDKMLKRICPIRPGERFSESAVERTYTRMNNLAPVKYVDVSFIPVSENEFDCHVVLARTKLNSVSAEIEGTYSAGDWGIAAGVGYANRNLFRGAEEFSVDARASYEWRQNGGRAIEAKASAELRFPSNVSVELGYKFQNRPDEYTRSIFTAGLQYQLNKPRIGWNQQFKLLDISYVYLPWISDAFRDQFLQPTNILKYSYENHFIVGLGYSGNYTTFRSRRPYQSFVNINYNIETAGNLLRLLAKPCRFPVDEESGNYTLFKTQFAQFAKADFSVTYNHIINPKHRLVWHADIGVAVPYGNSQTIPFEKRYFAGGANGVRGWAARTLGPGGYKGNGDWIDFNNQSGDVRLNLNLEYRYRVWSFIELAAFIDAGNIWTVFDYEAQPFGAFRWNEFYKQIALAYGAGIRLDFDFFILRVDMGVKLYDPCRLYDNSGAQWRTVANGMKFKDDVVFHFAIGYPF